MRLLSRASTHHSRAETVLNGGDNTIGAAFYTMLGMAAADGSEGSKFSPLIIVGRLRKLLDHY